MHGRRVFIRKSPRNNSSFLRFCSIRSIKSTANLGAKMTNLFFSEPLMLGVIGREVKPLTTRPLNYSTNLQMLLHLLTLLFCLRYETLQRQLSPDSLGFISYFRVFVISLNKSNCTGWNFLRCYKERKKYGYI